MPRIPDHIIQQILAENDIVDVIGAYFPLKRAGSNYRALCPFHNEKTPSFNVNPSRQIFHCFGCHAGGDAIKFVMLYENIAFPEAARKLADARGIVIPEGEIDPQLEQQRRHRRRLESLHTQAAAWFHNLLLKKDIAQPARDYLRGRAVSPDTARRWKLGYAPENSRLLLDWADQAGFTVRELADAGLAYPPENGRPPGARFRHRLMFPVNSDFGQTIAFSGRVLSPDQPGGKYVNSPETVLFTKGRHFYGLDKTKQAILRERAALLCEGQLDLIACFEAGIENVVAPLGTAFTPDQARLLKRHTDQVFLCFDSDEAGYKAAERTFRELLSAEVFVRVVAMPPGQDPDSLIKQDGPDAFRQRVSAARDFIDFQIEHQTRARDLTDLRQRMEFAREIAANVARVGDPVLQDTLVNDLASRLAVPAPDIRNLVQRSKPRADRRRRSATARPSANASTPAPEPRPPVVLRSRTLRFLCHLLLVDPDVREELTLMPPPEFLVDIPDSQILATVWSASFDPADLASANTFIGSLPPEQQPCLTELLSSDPPPQPLDTAHACLHEIERDALKNRIARHHSELRNPGLDLARRNFLLTNIQQLNARLESLKKLPAA